VKTDDIPLLGTYPVTREDFAVEGALQGMFSSIPGLSVVDKLSKRYYKLPWQLAHSVHYVNPLQGGDYAEFANYYGARLMICYRALWKSVQGVQVLKGEKELELADKLIGISVKVVDMGAGGRVLLSDFITFAADKDLDQSVLYRCYRRTRSFPGLAAALKDSGVVSDSTSAILLNRRMEVANTYVGNKTPVESFILTRLQGRSQAEVMAACYEAYEVLRIFGKVEPGREAPAARKDGKEEGPPPLGAAEELNTAVAVNLMQSWFEDGLTAALVAGDITPTEKLDSPFSRYLIGRAYPPEEAAVDLLYLSPLLLTQWGPKIKEYCGADKFISFALLETAIPASQHIKIPGRTPLARFFPIVSWEPDSLQVSVVNVGTGDYEFKQDFSLK